MKKTLLAIIAFSALSLTNCNKKDALDGGLDGSLNLQSEKGKAAVLATTTFNVTPTTSLNTTFWSNVQSALATGPVDVIFANGTYTRTSTITLANMGHATNLLTLKTASTVGGAVFTGSIATLMYLNTCQNIQVLRLKFTGPVTGYALRISNSQNMAVENCIFKDLPDVSYGALGVHNSLTNRVLVRNSIFENVGYDSHAHMIYGAYGIQRLSVVNNTFKDCSGSYVRFRGDLSDKGVVYNNIFTSTGTYLSGLNRVFIEIPVFNDVNPGDERMGTNFMITKNKFTYGTVGDQSTRFNVVFHSSGFNPPGRTYLISTADAALLSSGTVAQKRSVMSSKLGLDGNAIHFGGNTNTNVQYNVIYRCWNGYGSAGPWTGVASIGTAVNASGLATTETAAINFYP